VCKFLAQRSKVRVRSRLEVCSAQQADGRIIHCHWAVVLFTFDDGSHLKRGDVEIRGGNVDEVVLNHVDESRDGDPGTVQWLLNDVLVQM